MSSILDAAHDGRLLRLVMNRPDKRNALNAELCRELVSHLERAFRSQPVGAILLLGNGKHFCAGMDLSEIDTSRTNEITLLHEQLFTIGFRSAKPLVAGVTGASLGGGMGLVGNCHIVVAHPEATFGLTEIRIGMWPFLVFRALAAGIGERRVLEMALTGRIFPASEAKEIGLVHEISPDPQARAAEIARNLCQFSPTTIRSGMEFFAETRGQSWETAGRIARRIRDEIFSSRDFAEGLRAFREKRPPRWPSLEGR
ncbi:MAG TPA: enoyl-CoA hydratase/isomerase family protein [Bryobacteraceae bacterium]|nr:enoyl-CoA hydratase/isomerase family protein [Bryobacteraceae bacterium]